MKVKNAAGERAIAVTVRVMDTPGPCQQIMISSVTSDKCVLSWQPPKLDGGDRVKGYSIEKRETSRLTWTKVAESLETNHHKVCIRIISYFHSIYRHVNYLLPSLVA